MDREQLIKEFRRLGVPHATCDSLGWYSDDALSDFILAREQRLLDEIAKDKGFFGRTCARQSEKIKKLNELIDEIEKMITITTRHWRC